MAPAPHLVLSLLLHALVRASPQSNVEVHDTASATPDFTPQHTPTPTPAYPSTPIYSPIPYETLTYLSSAPTKALWSWSTTEWSWPSQPPHADAGVKFIHPPAPKSLPPLAHYRTEPKHKPAHFFVQYMTPHKELLAPGYWFIAPRAGGLEIGAQIIETDGELVWDSNLSHQKGAVSEFRVCAWKNQTDTHLCLHESRNRALNFRDLGNRVLDNTYRQVSPYYRDLGPNLTGPMGDSHEFNMLPNGETFLFPFTNHTIRDLRPYGGRQHGWVMSDCFLEAEIYTGRPFFVWCGNKHVNLWETTIFPDVPKRKNDTSAIAGTGNAYWDGWDFMHLNAIDRNNEGLYFVSGRHMNTIYIVAGPGNLYGITPGKIMWRLGGKINDFKMINKFIFSKQHHVKHITTNSTGFVISLFNNAWEGYELNEPTSPESSGQVIFVNNKTMEAHLMMEYKHPQRNLSGSRGSFDLLEGGNAVATWGHWLPEMTEWANDGTLLSHVHYEYPTCLRIFNGTGCYENHELPFSYRGHKIPWHAWPHWSPKLVAYSASCDARKTNPVVYASWNGATEIKGWNFYTKEGLWQEWKLELQVAKAGFETSAQLPVPEDSNGMLPLWVRADAIDKHGSVLGSTFTQMFVPDQSVRSQCDRQSCELGFEYLDDYNSLVNCYPSGPGQSWIVRHASPAAVLVALCVGVFVGIFVAACLNCIRRRRARRHMMPTRDPEEQKYNFVQSEGGKHPEFELRVSSDTSDDDNDDNSDDTKSRVSMEEQSDKTALLHKGEEVRR